MIPPLLLDVQPHHAVLDMCAAPGSKTAQLLEALHAPEALEPGAPPSSGYVVANDADSKRAYLLTHQCHRLGSHALIVSCHDAQLFPNLLHVGVGGGGALAAVVDDAGGEAASASNAPPHGRAVVGQQKTPGCFDRVLADVPCSGDGTARKNADVFRKWSPAAALALHSLQIQIAFRGLSLLKVGGLLAYSTCSLNPIEDEAVVAELIRRSAGAVELVDVGAALPGLIRSPGIAHWPVLDKDMTEWADWPSTQAVNAFGHFPKAGRRLERSMFPPSPAVAETLHLDRCLRVLPHAQDTGGFFIALLRKTAPLPSSVPWFNPTPGGAAGATATAGTARADSEDEVDAAISKPFYGRARGGGTGFSGGGGAGDAPVADVQVGEGGVGEGAPAIDTVAAHPGSGGEDDGDGENDASGDNDGVAAAAVNGEGAGGAASGGATGASGPVLSRPVQPQRWTRPRDPPATGAPSAPTRGVDSKGRALSGRFELTAYTPLAAAPLAEIVRAFGLRPSFPGHLLHSRSDGGRFVTLVADPIARIVLPQQRVPGAEEGRVKVINAGIKGGLGAWLLGVVLRCVSL